MKYKVGTILRCISSKIDYTYPPVIGDLYRVSYRKKYSISHWGLDWYWLVNLNSGIKSNYSIGDFEIEKYNIIKEILR